MKQYDTNSVAFIYAELKRNIHVLHLNVYLRKVDGIPSNNVNIFSFE